MYAELPAAAKNVPAKAILDGAEAGAAAKGKGKLLSTKEITLGKDKHPGRELLLEKDMNKIKTRIILAHNRIYTVIVGGKGDFATGKDADKFLDSFELTE